MSQHEVLHAGVPVVAIPFFGDQKLKQDMGRAASDMQDIMTRDREVTPVTLVEAEHQIRFVRTLFKKVFW
ncbi:hypothetical protein J6590_105421 [Homalodisca vitripennis]|nr:hypothetical protein J6590_105421 [Homalodisca vitripennis]